MTNRIEGRARIADCVVRRPLHAYLQRTSGRTPVWPDRRGSAPVTGKARRTGRNERDTPGVESDSR